MKAFALCFIIIISAKTCFASSYSCFGRLNEKGASVAAWCKSIDIDINESKISSAVSLPFDYGEKYKLILNIVAWKTMSTPPKSGMRLTLVSEVQRAAGDFEAIGSAVSSFQGDNLDSSNVELNVPGGGFAQVTCVAK
jgi:hypothetical protein